jgi:hypothetical protein
LGVRKSYIEKMFGWEEEERVGSELHRNRAFYLPVVGGNDYDVAGSGVGDIDQMPRFVDGYSARGGHVADVAYNAPLLRIEEIHGAGGSMGNQYHAVGEGNFIEARTPGNIENRDLLQSRGGGRGEKQRCSEEESGSTS